MGKLNLGKTLGDLGVQVIPDEPWTSAPARLRQKVNGVWTPIAWPEAPELYFPEAEFSVFATLDIDEETSTANAIATWTMTLEQVQKLQTGTDVRCRMFGESVWNGRVTCRI